MRLEALASGRVLLGVRVRAERDGRSLDDLGEPTPVDRSARDRQIGRGLVPARAADLQTGHGAHRPEHRIAVRVLARSHEADVAFVLAAARTVRGSRLPDPLPGEETRPRAPRPRGAMRPRRGSWYTFVRPIFRVPVPPPGAADRNTRTHSPGLGAAPARWTHPPGSRAGSAARSPAGSCPSGSAPPGCRSRRCTASSRRRLPGGRGAPGRGLLARSTLRSCDSRRLQG